MVIFLHEPGHTSQGIQDCVNQVLFWSDHETSGWEDFVDLAESDEMECDSLRLREVRRISQNYLRCPMNWQGRCWSA